MHACQRYIVRINIMCHTYHVATFSVWLLSHLYMKHKSGSVATLNQWIMFDTSHSLIVSA